MNEEAKHTLGPWRFDGDWNRIPTIFGADGSRVADVEKTSYVRMGQAGQYLSSVPKPEREANARLIAAAPDMLAALQWIVEIADKNYEQDEKLRTVGARTLKRISDRADDVIRRALRTDERSEGKQ